MIINLIKIKLPITLFVIGSFSIYPKNIIYTLIICYAIAKEYK